MKVGLIAVIAVIVIGGGVWYFTQSDTDTSTNGTTNTTASGSSARSIADIMNGGDSMKCEFSQNDQYGTQQWIMYVDGDKVRGDYSAAAVNGNPWEGHILSDGEWHYNWGTFEGQTVATKVQLSSLDINTNAASDSNVNTFDYDQDMNMNCDSWSADNATFVPPSDVTFTDLSAQMEAMRGLTNTVTDSQCAACDGVGDEATQAACRQAVGC